MKTYNNLFQAMISPEHLFCAWRRFRHEKGKKRDVKRFEWRLEENIFELHRELASKTYKHGAYTGFYITDPKQRHIHKATVRDRVLHHAVVQTLTPIFEPTFIALSFSCRIGKGTHKGFTAVEKMARKVSDNYTKPCFGLKCDIKKFFDSIVHSVLLGVLGERIKDPDVMWLLREIVGSFNSSLSTDAERRGLPIGNLTSQLFANVYMNVFDQFVKHELRVKQYARYTDDFIVLSSNKEQLWSLVPQMQVFLNDTLSLTLHHQKTTLRTLHQGLDFLGYITLPHHRLLRTTTKRRLFKGLRRRAWEYKRGVGSKTTVEQSLQSYLGVLSHANTSKATQKLKNLFWFLMNE